MNSVKVIYDTDVKDIEEKVDDLEIGMSRNKFVRDVQKLIDALDCLNEEDIKRFLDNDVDEETKQEMDSVRDDFKFYFENVEESNELKKVIKDTLGRLMLIDS